jgi:hypothetical protein
VYQPLKHQQTLIFACIVGLELHRIEDQVLATIVRLELTPLMALRAFHVLSTHLIMKQAWNIALIVPIRLSPTQGRQSALPVNTAWF